MDGSSILDLAESLRRPEYTGENRCMPCTIANTGIAGALSLAVAVALRRRREGRLAAVVGGLTVLAASLAAIALRGYLVPYTPQITKRYFPEWLLAKFDKVPEEAEAAAAPNPDPDQTEVDPEEALVSAGALEPCESRDDLCLTPEFREEWRDSIQAVRSEGVGTDDILSALSMEDLAETATLTRFGDAVVLERGTEEVGKWESQAALVADVAAARELADRYDRWDDLGGVDRSRLLRGLRIFVEECPLCEGVMDLGQDTVESCCRSYDVVAVTCGDCDSRLFEERWEGEEAAA